MAEEFVDLYQVLELPIDADRGALRKRINELYMNAQRNLDHRHFATRIKFQELFEVTLPQARYILLDDGRRDEYNRLVNAFRSPGGMPAGAPPALKAVAPTNFSAAETLPETTGGFSLLSAPDIAPAGIAPAIAPLPQAPLDPAQMAQEREELWKKWKSGLEAALHIEESDAPKARGAVTSAPTSFSIAPVRESLASQSQSQVASASTSAPIPKPASVPAPKASAPEASAPEASKTMERPKVAISFDFGAHEAAAAKAPAAVAGFEPETERAVSAAEIEARRTQHRRQITREILVNVGLIWGIAGAALVLVPGLVALIAAASHYYPRGAKPLLGYPSVRLWSGGFLVLGVATFFASRELSKMMRRQKAMQLSALSYEELLRQSGQS